MKVKALILALAFAGAAAAYAQAPNMGTWKLNEAKSKITAGIVKNSTVVYEAQGENIKVTTDGTGAEGTPVHTEWTGMFDGKDYPVTGDPTADTRSYTKINDNTLSMVSKKDGKPTLTGRIVVAPDGKSRTVSVTRMDDAGKKTTATAVYNKQ